MTYMLALINNHYFIRPGRHRYTHTPPALWATPSILEGEPDMPLDSMQAQGKQGTNSPSKIEGVPRRGEGV